MLKVETYLDKSSIHGIGCFANRDIKQDEIVWLFDVRFDIKAPKSVIDYQQEGVLYDFLMMNGWWVNERDEIFLICCADNARFINHSKNPNVTGDYMLIATKDIEAGEEILQNYEEMGVIIEKKKDGSLKFKSRY